MSNSDLQVVAGVKEKPTTFPAMLKASFAEIQRALPRHLNADRMSRIALTCFRETPGLQNCTPHSIIASVIKASQLGLEPGLNGRAYLIPYKEECQFVPGWKGLLELVNRTGRAAAWTGAVFEGDKFDFQLGDSPYAKHSPGDEDDPERLVYAYAIGRIRNNEWPIVEVWTNGKILKHRDRFNKVGKKHYSYGNWEMYARKVPLMQVLKYLPSSPELEQAMALSNAADAGVSQGLTIDGVLNDTYTPPNVDASTGAKDVTPGPSFGEIKSAIENAKNTDDVDAAEAMVDSLAEQFRPELHALAKERRGKFV